MQLRHFDENPALLAVFQCHGPEAVPEAPTLEYVSKPGVAFSATVSELNPEKMPTVMPDVPNRIQYLQR